MTILSYPASDNSYLHHEKREKPMTLMTNTTSPPPFGQLLKLWRAKRRYSQLDLSLASNVSQRHISFLESGRSQPSRDMVLQLATTLEMPLEAQNSLLTAAGYAPFYQESNWHAPQLRPVQQALDFMLAQQEPYPAVVLNERWELYQQNGGALSLLNWLLTPEDLMAHVAAHGELNLMRLLFDPAGLRPWVEDWTYVAGCLIQRIHREALAAGGSEPLQALLDELLSYTAVPQSWQAPDWSAEQVPLLTMTFNREGQRATLFSTVAVLGMPYDITLQKVRVETFYPADEATDAWLKALAEA